MVGNLGHVAIAVRLTEILTFSKTPLAIWEEFSLLNFGSRAGMIVAQVMTKCYKSILGGTKKIIITTLL